MFQHLNGLINWLELNRRISSVRGLFLGPETDLPAQLLKSRLASLESELSRRNQMKADGAGKTGELLCTSTIWRLGIKS